MFNFRNNNKFMNKIKSLPFLKAVSILVGGTVFGHLVTVLASPVISRLYSPSDFGVFAAFNSLLLIGVSFSSLGYHLALPLTKDDETASNLVVLGISIQSVIFLLLTFFAFSPLKNTFCDYFGLDSLLPYIGLLPLGILFAALFELLNYWALSRKKFLEMSRAKIAKNVYGAIGGICLGWLGFRPWGLLWGQVLNYSGGWFAFLRNFCKEGFRWGGCAVIKEVAIRYKRFPQFSLWSAVLNTMSNQFMPLAFVAFWGQEIAGWFAFSVMVLQLPVALIGQAVGQVFFQRASEHMNRGDKIADITMSTMKNLVVLGTIPLLGLGMIAPELFSVVWGQNWQVAGLYSSFLSPYMLMVFCFSPLSVVLYALEMQDKDLFLGVLLFIMRVLSILGASPFSGNLAVIVIYGTLSFCTYAFLLCWLLKLSGNSWIEGATVLAKEMAIAAILGSPVLGLRVYGFSSTVLFLLFSFTWGLLVYSVRIFYFYRNLRKRSVEIP